MSLKTKIPSMIQILVTCLGRDAAPYKLPVQLDTHFGDAVWCYLHLLVGSGPSRSYLNKALMIKHAVE